MFITKKHIPRRTFLRGAGVTLGLPLLSAMIPAQTAIAQTAANSKTRFVGIFYPHGMAPGHWEHPEAPLPEKMSEIMQSLEPVRIKQRFWADCDRSPPSLPQAPPVPIIGLRRHFSVATNPERHRVPTRQSFNPPSIR
jgi:hypothetical protein